MQRMQNWVKRGVAKGHVTRKARDTKFGTQKDAKGYYARNVKLGQKERGLGHVTYFLNFGPPSISP